MKAAQFGKDDGKRALRFARDHDWGRGAYLDGNWIRGLEHRWTDESGREHVRTVSLPARVRDLRAFGGY